MNQELPPPKNVRKMTPAEGRFACYWWSAQHSGVAWSEREVSTREACAKGEAEIKWARDKAKEIHQELIEDSNRRTAGQPCMSKAEHTAKEAEQERISEACSSWKIGEEIRQRRLWIEECEEWAEMKIQGRKTHMEKEGFSLAEFAVEGLESVQCDGPEARSRLQHTALWLPVYYEYARQSPHLLMWSRMLNTMGKGDIMRPGAASELTTALKHQLGGGWVSALSWLCGYLGEDRSFSCVPSEKRLSVACGAANATLSHIEVNPDTWAIEDGGRPACPTESKWAGRRLVSIANLEEATTTRSIGVFDARIKEHSSYEYRDGLNATVHESFTKKHKGAWTPGKSQVERRGNDDLRGRKIDANGNEIIVLKLNWNQTNDQDIGEAVTRLCKSIRPTKWPECIEEAGNQKQQRDKALSVLLYWRMTASIAAPIGSNLDEAERKRELEVMRTKLGRAIRDRDDATTWFKDITGDDDPWWLTLVSNLK